LCGRSAAGRSSLTDIRTHAALFVSRRRNPRRRGVFARGRLLRRAAAGGSVAPRAAGAKRPQQVLIRRLARGHEASIRKHDVGFDEAIGGEPYCRFRSRRPREKRQSCHPRGRDDAGRRCLSEGARCVVDVARKAAAAHPHCRRRRIDPHPLHHGEVDHQAVVYPGEPGPLCPPPRLAIGGLLSRPISTPRRRRLAKAPAYRFATVAKMA
jgi:hypothetical protein